MSLHPSQVGRVDATAATLKSTASAKKSSGTSFSAQLKDASSTAESTSTKVPAGETTKALDGHKYADILTGPRKGLFLNTGHNSRAGEAFVMVKKNGREYHIYGTGAHRVVIGLKPAADSNATTGTTDAGKITTDTSTTTSGS